MELIQKQVQRLNQQMVQRVELLQMSALELEAYLRELKGYGLAGAEAIYSEYTPEMSRRYGALIEKLGLLPSGGTDFHGTMKPHIAIGKGFGELSIPYSLLNAIKLLTKKGKNDKI